MSEEIIVAQEVQREVVDAPRKNFELLSNDTFLNGEINNVVEEKPTEVVETPKDVVTDLGLEAEKPVEEVKEEVVVEEKPTEVVEEKLELDELSLETETNQEAEEGSWAAIAKLDGFELKEDTLEAYKEAITSPYESKLKEMESLTTDKLLSKFTPEVKMLFDLAEAGLTIDQIVAPYTKLNELRSMSPAELVRLNLEGTKKDWSPEMIDAEMEILTAVDGRLEHEHKKLIVELDVMQKEEQDYRNGLIEKYKSNSENTLLTEKRNGVESVTKALNNMSVFMDQPLSPEVKQGLVERMNSGKYDQLFNDPKEKAEFITWKELGQKAQKNLVAKSYAKGKSEITNKLHNIPPVVTGGAGINTTQNTTGNFEKLKGDTYLNG